jgi:hypothetical protein
MPRLIELLKEHPALGMLTSLFASLQSFMQTSTPVLQYLGLLLGTAIGLLTLLTKIREWRRKGAK